jgi:serine/threonine protein kinase
MQSARYESASSELANGENMSTTVVTTDQHQKCYRSAVVDLSSELQLEDPMQLTEHAYYGSPPEELSIEDQPEDPMQLTEQTYYGSAPEHLWSELQTEEDAETVDDERFDSVRNIDPSELELVEEIAQGGQAHVYLAKWKTRGGPEVVVKRYKGRRVDVVQLRRRLAKAHKNPAYSLGICELFGYSEDNTTGEVSVVMEAMRGDLRNLIDLRVRYLKSRTRNNATMKKKRGAHTGMITMMPFPKELTLDMMRRIAYGVEWLHSRGLIHKDLKASNIFVSPHDSKQGFITSRNVKLKRDLAYDHIWVSVGDYESSNGVVGTAFWRAPEVLKALRDNITPTYSAAVDVYGFGMVCYELLTGLIPFQGHSLSDYELVLSRGRPELLDYLSPEITQLLHNCWHMDPCQRPDWDEITEVVRAEWRRSLISSMQNRVF